ncbi:MAG: exodeoxyribonuclease III, partial [Pseudomonadales bacterium]|nr:exodeoxyribonuclease III [Pseudomonadales bacterium]
SGTPPLYGIKGHAPGRDDDQRRLVSARFPLADGRHLTVINGYFPQGESRKHPTKFTDKERFYAALADHLSDSHEPDNPVVLLGDMNVAPLDHDIGIGENNMKRWLRDGKCSFLPEERDWLRRLMDWGMVDVFRHRYPDVDDRFSWFDYRSRGFERNPRRGLRIDLILASLGLGDHIRDAGIDYDIRAMDKPSDHCPVWAEFDLELKT